MSHCQLLWIQDPQLSRVKVKHWPMHTSEGLVLTYYTIPLVPLLVQCNAWWTSLQIKPFVLYIVTTKCVGILLKFHLLSILHLPLLASLLHLHFFFVHSFLYRSCFSHIVTADHQKHEKQARKVARNSACMWMASTQASTQASTHCYKCGFQWFYKCGFQWV